MLEENLSRLSSKHREVLQLRYYLDMDYQGIADLLKIPVGTVKSRISTGLARLRESMGVISLDIEAMLKSKKMELDQIEVPEELETRLRNTLDRRSSRLGARIDWRIVAVGLILLLRRLPAQS